MKGAHLALGSGVNWADSPGRAAKWHGPSTLPAPTASPLKVQRAWLPIG